MQPGEFRHFILNFDQASLSINGIRIGMGMIGGPLPKFAVIGIDGPLLFWWGTAAALDFVPKGQSTVRKFCSGFYWLLINCRADWGSKAVIFEQSRV